MNVLCPSIRQISMLRFIAMSGVWAHENVDHSKRRENVIYRGRSRIVEPLIQLENKQQIMQTKVETQHNHMYSLYMYTGSLCNEACPLTRFTCIVTSQVFVEIWMRWSISLSSAFYPGMKHLWIVFSFNITLPNVAGTCKQHQQNFVLHCTCNKYSGSTYFNELVIMFNAMVN